MKLGYSPSYLNLYHSGELEERLKRLEEKLASCDVCPRGCHINRYEKSTGFCRSGILPYVSSVCDHHGEEPVLSGIYGSGTVFFGSCNLRCVFCQNHQISQDQGFFKIYIQSTQELAERIVDLQIRKQVHNINFVSPGHFIPQMVRIIFEAIPLGLNVPIVYNSNGYDAVESLRMLEGIVDIYLPDIKYADERTAFRYSRVKNYPEITLAAIKEMYRQVGSLKTDRHWIATSGVLVRHLVLPNDLAESERVMKLLAEQVSPDIAISLMSQYYPMHKALNYPLLSRPVSFNEYNRVLKYMEKLKLTKGFSQQMDAPEYYLPDFALEDHPFTTR